MHQKAISEVDPLSKPTSSAAITKASIETARKTDEDILESKLKTPWQMQKKQILTNYTTTGNMTVGANAFNDFEGSGVEDGKSYRSLGAKPDRYAQRLANLERQRQPASDGKVVLTQAEYAAHVKKLSSDLDSAWARDERVASLKLAIQIAKLLSDTTVPRFYPCTFVMVTDALDKFSNMVFNRLKNRADEVLNEGVKGNVGKRIILPENFTSADIPQGAKETCRNWFYKIACIRELLPRAYIEITLLKW